MAYSIDYLYRIQDRFSAALLKMNAASNKFIAGANKIQGKLGIMENKFKTAGAKLANLRTGLAAIGAGMFLRGALEESMAFQRSLNLTKAVTGAATEEMDRMRQAALDWGSSTQFSSGQVAQAMAELGKMGNSTNDILALMPGTMALAAAGEIDMAEAANFSMGILNQFGLELDKAGMVADILATGASGAATSVRGIASAMNNAGLMSKMAGLTMKDTTIALMAMAKKNLEGAEAGTMLKNAMKALTVMPGKVRSGFNELGINIDNFRDKTTGQMTDFFGLIAAMKNAGANAQNMGKMFDIRQMTAFSALVETSSDDLATFTDVMGQVDGNAEKMKNTLNEGLNPLIEFKSLMQNLKVIVGGFVTETLAPMLEKFNTWFSNMQRNNPKLLKGLTKVLMVLTAFGAIVVPLGLLLSSIGTIIGVIKTIIGLTKLWAAVQAVFNVIMTANPIGLIVVGIAALIAGIILLIKNFDKVKAAVQKVWNKFSELLENPIFSMAAALFAPFITVPALIIKNWEPLKAFFIQMWETITLAFKTAVDFMKALFFTFADVFLTTFGNIVKGIMAAAAEAGDFLGFDTTGLDNAISKLDELQTKVRAQSFVGGVQEEVPPGASRVPSPAKGGFMQRSTELASLKVYSEEGIKVAPYEPSKRLGYNLESRGM